MLHAVPGTERVFNKHYEVLSVGFVSLFAKQESYYIFPGVVSRTRGEDA